MNAIAAVATKESFIPLALEEEDIATYAAIAHALGCTAEECGEGFMMATPLAREAAVLLWRSAVALMSASGATASLRLQDTLGTLRTLLGLDPRLVPHAALAEAGLRYRI